MNVKGSTQLIGLIGWPVAHSFSPAMQNAAAADLGLDWVYVALPVAPQDVEAAVAGLPALGFRGVNVTVPHKQTVMPFLDVIDKGAQAVGAVNTIVVEREGEATTLTGYNTDAPGFMADLKSLNVPAAGRDCLVLGAGGSARAIIYALAEAGGKVKVLARREEQAQGVVQDLSRFLETPAGLSAHALGDLRLHAGRSEAPLIVNSTPLGMHPNVESSVWPESVDFPEDSFVYDLVYNPRRTKLMRQAQESGCGAANGLGMLVQQGVLAFELWTGNSPDAALMASTIK